MKKIMVATDFSERSDRALRRATLLAKRIGAALFLVHVVDNDQARRIVESERDMARRLLHEMATTVKDVDGVVCGTRVVLGAPYAGIANAVEEIAPDLLVIGPHRRQALRDVFMGTTAERTIRTVALPVLMVNASPAGPYRHAMLTTDLSEGARRAARTFLALNIDREAKVSILHVFDAPALRLAMSHAMPKSDKEHYLEGERKSAARALSEFVHFTGIGPITQIVYHDKTTPAQEILNAAKAGGVDLIVIGTHGRSGLARFFLGSVAEHVLRNADRDVLAVPSTMA
ncbi:universal stress protein [Aurantimonas marina]|uniref:universal stress protein n=1 Tax=Aurantimonas marina TaxID=2780508 RepID=UPI0019D1FE4D|nr:universal stress protein [Aurantimonas marina]